VKAPLRLFYFTLRGLKVLFKQACNPFTYSKEYGAHGRTLCRPLTVLSTAGEDPWPLSEKRFLGSGPSSALVRLMKQTYLLSPEVDLEAYFKGKLQ